MRKRLWLAAILMLGALAVAAWGANRGRVARQFRATLDQVKQEIAAGQYGRARKRLVELGSSPDAAGEVDYYLGICELYRGQAQQALAAWDRVPRTGPFGGRADSQRGMLAMSSG